MTKLEAINAVIERFKSVKKLSQAAKKSGFHLSTSSIYKWRSDQFVPEIWCFRLPLIARNAGLQSPSLALHYLDPHYREEEEEGDGEAGAGEGQEECAA